MDRDSAVAQIRKACTGISVELMKISPAVSALGDKEGQDEIYRTVFELTKELETTKKRLAKASARTRVPSLELSRGDEVILDLD
jgi:hypothetical protein